VEEDYNIYELVGPGAGIVESYVVDDVDGEITVGLLRKLENPAIKGIEILAVDGPAPGPSCWSADPSELEFGEVEVGESAVAASTLTNVGGEPVEVAGASIDGSAAFSVASALPIVIEPGASADIEVVFEPSAAGEHTATLTIEHDGFE
jgi:hypothetical protein